MAHPVLWGRRGLLDLPVLRDLRDPLDQTASPARLVPPDLPDRSELPDRAARRDRLAPLVLPVLQEIRDRTVQPVLQEFRDRTVHPVLQVFLAPRGQQVRPGQRAQREPRALRDLPDLLDLPELDEMAGWS